jgi:hypothetical protein
MHLPVWYRAVNEHRWHTGVTQSVSTSGARIRVHTRRVPSDQILVEIPLPVAPGCLFGEGRVVRTVLPNEDTEMTTLTIAVDRYRIGRRDALLGPPTN